MLSLLRATVCPALRTSTDQAGHRPAPACAAGKRALDLLLGTAILVVAAPLLAVLALVVRLDSPGPILFRQVRIGRDGRPFRLYKFRTMYQDADPAMHRTYVQSLIRRQAHGGNDEPSSGPRAVFKLTADPRVTGAGRLLRRTSLDELPQVFNVLKGDMSLVGPRPSLPYEVQEYEEWHKARLAVLPGITGWWQVWGRSQVPFDEMVRMDLEYISKQSLWLDLRILLLTLPAVVLGKGAV